MNVVINTKPKKKRKPKKNQYSASYTKQLLELSDYEITYAMRKGSLRYEIVNDKVMFAKASVLSYYQYKNRRQK
jgi:hypothetical protein